MTIEAGVALKAAQEAAITQGCILPLSMASEGSAQIGGVFSTNAGGNNTVRYGKLATTSSDLRSFCPTDASGMDCAACAKTTPDTASASSLSAPKARLASSPPESETGAAPAQSRARLLRLPSVQAALDLLVLCRGSHHDSIHAFEYISGTGLDFILKHFPDAHTAGATRRALRPGGIGRCLADSGCALGSKNRWRSVRKRHRPRRRSRRSSAERPHVEAARRGL